MATSFPVPSKFLETVLAQVKGRRFLRLSVLVSVLKLQLSCAKTET